MEPEAEGPAVDARGLPLHPGYYHWIGAGWDPHARVLVYRPKRSRYLMVLPPGDHTLPVRISPRIAGRFKVAKDQTDAS